MMIMLLVTLAMAMLALAAAGRSAARATTSSRPTLTSNRALARVQAAELLRRTPVPAGATPTAANPGSHFWLDSPADGVPDARAADAHRYWSLAGDPRTIFEQIKAHPPAGARISASGTGSANGIAQSWDVTFSLPAVPGRILERGIGIELSAGRSGGTAIRADGYAVWEIPRAPSEVVPAGARTVEVWIDRPGGRGFLAAAVTDRRKVARLTSFVNSRPVTQQITPCPASDPSIRLADLRFEGAGAGPPLARAVETGCGGLEFSIRGHRGRPLDLGYPLESLLWSLRALPVCRPDQLSATATRPAREPRAILAELLFHDVSDTACAVEGFGRVKLIGPGGGELTPSVHNTAAATPVVLLTPSDTTDIALSWAAPSRSCRAPRPAEIDVTLPGGPGRHDVNVASWPRRLAPCHSGIAADPLQ